MSDDRAMMTSPLSRVSLMTLGIDAPVLNVIERPFVGYLNLRGSADDSVFMAAVNDTIGVELPEVANTLTHISGLTALWLGPDEWLLVCETNNEVALHKRLCAVLSGCHSAITNVSGGNTLLEISGSMARNLLEKGCPLDLHGSKFGPGQCAQSVIDKTGVTLFQTADETYHLIVRRSFAEYLAVWIVDAANEFVR